MCVHQLSENCLILTLLSSFYSLRVMFPGVFPPAAATGTAVSLCDLRTLELNGLFSSPKGRKRVSSRTDSCNVAVKMKLWTRVHICRCRGWEGEGRLSYTRSFLVLAWPHPHCQKVERELQLRGTLFRVSCFCWRPWCLRLPEMKKMLPVVLPQSRTRSLCHKEGTAIGTSVIYWR